MSTHAEAVRQFVLYWGEMAPAWGINRTMAQIHALLFAEDEALDTDTIMVRLDISRGNANMNLRNLLDWGLVSKVQQPGSRKDWYTAEKDVWEVAAIIIRERQNRELAPVRENLNQTLEILGKDGAGDAQTEAFRERIRDFIRFLDFVNEFSEAMLPYINSKTSASIQNLLKLAQTARMVTGRFTGKKPGTP